MAFVSEYVHVIPNLEVFPRVYYFHKRYNDLLGKFERFKDKYQTFFDEKQPVLEKNSLQNGVAIKVIGRTDLRPEEYLTVASDLYRVQSSKPPNEDTYINYIIAVDPHKEMMKTPYSPSKSYHEAPMDVSRLTIDSSPDITIVICCTIVEELDDNALTEIQLLSTELCGKQDLQSHDCVLFCRCNKKFTEPDKKAFLEKIADFRIFHQVVIDQKCGDDISNCLEYKLADSFKTLESALLPYKRTLSKHCLKKQLETNNVIVDQINGFFHHSWRFNDDIEPVEPGQNDEKHVQKARRLARAIRCALVQPLSDKYDIPVWLCNHILIAKEFENMVVKQISDKTKKPLKEYYDEAIHTKKLNVRHSEKTSTENPDTHNTSSALQTDIRDVLNENCRTLNVFSTAVKKMQLEITACLKRVKSQETKESEGAKQAFQMAKESEGAKQAFQTAKDLKKEISNFKEVYGVGTIYGQLEVHVTNKGAVENVRKKVQNLFRKKNIFFPLVVQALETPPKVFVYNQYENGDQIVCSHGIGTLGGFLDGDDGHLYGLTCAHVVDRQRVMDVYIRNGANYHLFAHSDPNLTIFTGDENKPLIDLAALRVVEDMKPGCIKFLKDVDGMIRPGILSTETTSELLGNQVYKHGAKTQLTKGLICSDDYHIFGSEESAYILLIDSYDDNDEDFAECGDSGSLVCSSDVNEVYVVKAVGLLTAGEFSPEDRETPLCISFRLFDGLVKLTSQGGVGFSFPTKYI